MTTPSEDAVDVAQYAAQYEMLRSQVIGAVSGWGAGDAVVQPRGAGLALLLREGLPAWMRAVRQILHAAATSPGASGGPTQSPTTAAVHPIASRSMATDTRDTTSLSPAVLPVAHRRDVSALLASLVLSTHGLAGAASRQEYSPCR
jgi:hypothetical protein